MMQSETHCCPKCRGVDVSIDLQTNELTCNNPKCKFVGKSGRIDISEVIKKRHDPIYKNQKSHQSNLLYIDPKSRGFI
jgi:hypothetical protein